MHSNSKTHKDSNAKRMDRGGTTSPFLLQGQEVEPKHANCKVTRIFVGDPGDLHGHLVDQNTFALNLSFTAHLVKLP